MAQRRSPEQVKQAFATEFHNLQRLLRLRGGGKRKCDGDIPLKHFVCAIWVDPARRKIWDDALARLGHSDVVREAYADLYALDEFDGAKLRDYAHLWNRLGLTPSEVDYAFFLDRITHFGGPPDEDERTVDSMTACMRGETQAISVNGAARRCLSRLQPHDTQPQFRLARDVAYYLDAYPEGALSEREIKTWGGYVPLSAVHNFGLSDSKSMHIADAAPALSLGPDVPLADSDDLTSAERKACPSGVLWPVHGKPRK
jgi:hypothetical protein